MNEMVEYDEVELDEAEGTYDDMELSSERGVTTAEYAVGVVMVVALVVVMINAIRSGWFGQLVEVLIRAFFTLITQQLGLK